MSRSCGRLPCAKPAPLGTLLNEERAIVSDITGTTRDTIEDHITLDGIRFNFIDTAGIRQTTDAIEQMGIERALEKAKSASTILLLFDATRTDYAAFTAFRNQVMAAAGDDKHMVLLANKTDLPEFNEETFASTFSKEKNIITISAKNKTHIDQLKKEPLQAVNIGRVQSGETIVTNARHHATLKRAAHSLHEIVEGLDKGITGDFLAIDIRKTLYHLGEITGEINADDLLNNIFSSFCIGK